MRRVNCKVFSYFYKILEIHLRFYLIPSDADSDHTSDSDSDSYTSDCMFEEYYGLEPA